MFTTRPEIAGTFGVVATTHWLASATGMAVLERGGNAFDAAAAAGFVLQVAEPTSTDPAATPPSSSTTPGPAPSTSSAAKAPPPPPLPSPPSPNSA